LRNVEYLLPPGCKDLIDAINCVEDIVLVHAGEQENEFVIKFKLSGLQKENIEILVEGRHLRVAHRLSNSQRVIEVPPSYEIARARAMCVQDTLRIFVPKC
jgi:HSP20 family molecular chaperone IbpA